MNVTLTGTYLNDLLHLYYIGADYTGGSLVLCWCFTWIFFIEKVKYNILRWVGRLKRGVIVQFLVGF